MITYASMKYFINAAVNAVSALVIVVIFISCMVRKNNHQTKKAFAFVLIDLFFLVSSSVVVWVLVGMSVTPTNHPELYNATLALTVVDFFLNNMAGVLFLNYIFAISGPIGDKRKQKRLIQFLIAFSFAATGIFTTSWNNGWLYSIPGDGHVYYTPAYSVFLTIAALSIWLAFYYVLKNIKTFKRKVVPLLSYYIIPFLLMLLDQQFDLSITYVGFAFLSLSVYVGVDIAQDRETLAKEAEMAKREAENMEMNLRLTVSQIQPHFLYNTLGTIYQLCGKSPDMAQEAIKNFTKYLRLNMVSIDKNTPILFEKELEHTKTYLSVESLRFFGALNVEFDIQCTDFEIPALSLQPLVENAVKHGIRSRAEGGTIAISSKREENRVLVTIHDDGMGFDVSGLIESEHVGIANVRKRLEYMCGGRLEIESQIGVGTTATIILEETQK